MDKCDSRNLLRTNNLKVTKQRLMLLNSIISSNSIFSANDLHKELKSDMDLATIYRILGAFLEKGIVREILTPEESKIYELACIHNPVHPHFNCNICGKISCLEAADENLLSKLKAEYSNFLISDISIQFTGTCINCTK